MSYSQHPGHQHNYSQAPYPGPIVVVSPKSPGVAVALEIVPGFFLQTFGIGNLYAGNVGLGVAMLIGYWVVAFVNFLLCFILIGFITYPICWLAMMIFASMTAYSKAKGSQLHY